MSVVPSDDKRLIFIPLEKAIVCPSGFVQHIKDHWWVVHPEKGLVFWDKKVMSPQCNSNESLTRRIWEQMYPWAEIKFIPSVFRTINPSDWTQ